MAYNVDLASYLSGATHSQLNRWAREGMLVPEVSPSRPKLYSFRDLVALRTISNLRAHVSLQRIRKALDTLQDQEFTEHLSQHRFATDRQSIKVWTDSGFLDLLSNPGQWEFKTFEDIYAPFENFRGRLIPDLRRPSESVEVDPDRLGGEPTVFGTRVSYSLIADLSEGEDGMTPEEIAECYPSVPSRDVPGVLAFDQAVRGNAA